MNMNMKVGILTHTDLDGVSSAVLLHYLYNEEHEVIVKFADYDNIQEKLEEFPELGLLFIADLSLRDNSLLDKFDYLKKNHIVIFDHHKSSENTFNDWKNKATIYFDCSGNSCTTDLIWDCSDFLDENLKHLKDATHSIDLWIRDVPDGQNLSDVISMLGAEKTFNILKEDYSRVYYENFTIGMKKSVDSAEEKRNQAKSLALNTCSICHPFDDDVKLILAFTHGYQSDVGDMFLQDNPLAWIILFDLTRNTASYRSNEETLQKYNIAVNEIAAKTPGGGGHPLAAGSPMPEKAGQIGTNTYAARFAAIINEIKESKDHYETI